MLPLFFARCLCRDTSGSSGLPCSTDTRPFFADRQASLPVHRLVALGTVWRMKSCHCYTTTLTSLFVVRVRNTSSAIWVVAGFGPSLSLAASPNLFFRHCYNSLCHKADYFHSLSSYLPCTHCLWHSVGLHLVQCCCLRIRDRLL